MPGFEKVGIEEKNAVINVFEKNNGVLFAHGFDKMRNGNYEVRNLEKKAKEYFGSKYCLAVSSGTAALKIALKCVKLDIGDEIITQAHNFISDGEVILDYKCKPIIVDVDKSLNLDPNKLEESITNKSKAVIISDMLGNGCDIKKIENICKKHNLLLIDDACEMIGGKYDGKYYGTFGDIGVFSLDFGKNITSGEGGLIFTDNDEYYNIMKQYTDHGHLNNPHFARGLDDFGIPGFNFRMTELQGAIAQVQIDKLEDIVKENKERYDVLDKNLGFFEKRIIYDKVEPSYDTFIFFIDDFILKKLVLKYIYENGIGTKNLPDALRWHCFYYWDHIITNDQKDKIKYSKELLNKSIAIPIMLNNSIQKYIDLCEGIKKVYDEYKLGNYKLELENIAIIPSRSGSKGMPNKNASTLKNGKSLIEMVTRNIDDSRLVDGIFFTTDSEDYKNIYKKEALSKDITFDYLRDSKISQDESSANEFILDAIKYLHSKKIYPKNIIICQVTSPLYTYHDVDNFIINFNQSKSISQISVSETIQNPRDMVIEKDSKLKMLITNKIERRQEYDNYYYINGCLYMTSLDNYIEKNNKKINPFFEEGITNLFKMDIKSGIDIDEPFDLKLLETFI